ncbi:MAG: hypothetical protein PHH26_01985 [Candidatus Thermoplasmatota archaeon]|nr:hypothetical protein [Candidatus Thermoplasmatota archaeon]
MTTPEAESDPEACGGEEATAEGSATVAKKKGLPSKLPLKNRAPATEGKLPKPKQAERMASRATVGGGGGAREGKPKGAALRSS